MDDEHAFGALDEALWRLPTVVDRTGLSGGEILQREKEGKFPRRLKVGERAVAWLATEVIRWMRSHPRAEDSPTVNQPPRGRGRPRKQPPAESTMPHAH